MGVDVGVGSQQERERERSTRGRNWDCRLSLGTEATTAECPEETTAGEEEEVDGKHGYSFVRWVYEREVGARRKKKKSW